MCLIKMSVHSKFKWLTYLCYYGPAKPGGWRAMVPPFFCIAKKKGSKGEEIKNFKTKTIKRLSSISKCHCFNPLERLEFKKFYCRPTIVTGNTFKCSITSPLWNPFRQSCVFWQLSSVVFFIILIFWSCLLSRKNYEIETKLHSLTHFNVKNLYEPFKTYVRLEVRGGS